MHEARKCYDQASGQKCFSASSHGTASTIRIANLPSMFVTVAVTLHWLSSGFPMFQGYCKLAIFGAETKWDDFKLGDDTEKLKKLDPEDDFYVPGKGSPSGEDSRS